MEQDFSKADLATFFVRGIDTSTVAAQFGYFLKGIPKLKLQKPATLNDGILYLSEKSAADFAAFYDQFKNSCSVIKFVPASGAASRMFKFLLEFLSDYNEKKESVENYLQRHNNASLEQFFASFEKFPFYDAILCATQKGKRTGAVFRARRTGRRRLERQCLPHN